MDGGVSVWAFETLNPRERGSPCAWAAALQGSGLMGGCQYGAVRQWKKRICGSPQPSPSPAVQQALGDSLLVCMGLSRKGSNMRQRNRPLPHDAAAMSAAQAELRGHRQGLRRDAAISEACTCCVSPCFPCCSALQGLKVVSKTQDCCRPPSRLRGKSVLHCSWSCER